MAGYERATINGHSYLVCAECRRLHEPGYAVLYPVLIPGVGIKARTESGQMAQSLCGNCYKLQYSRMYPRIPVPNVPDTALPDEAPIPLELVDRKPRTKTEIELFEEALSIAKATGGAEQPFQVYTRLKQVEKDKLQTEISQPS